jgi:16S rRNA processing protein RimM
MAPADVVTDDVVVVGRVGAPYGVQGWVHIHSYTAPVENIQNYRPWLLRAKQGTWRPVNLSQCKRHQKGFIAQIADVSDREAAAQLSGHWVGVPAQTLPAIAELDEYYWRDLQGCNVVDVEGVMLGNVDHLMETGANDVLVVAGAQGQILIPFVAQYVEAVDIANRKVVVNWDDQW